MIGNDVSDNILKTNVCSQKVQKKNKSYKSTTSMVHFKILSQFCSFKILRDDWPQRFSFYSKRRLSMHDWFLFHFKWEHFHWVLKIRFDYVHVGCGSTRRIAEFLFHRFTLTSCFVNNNTLFIPVYSCLHLALYYVGAAPPLHCIMGVQTTEHLTIQSSFLVSV